MHCGLKIALAGLAALMAACASEESGPPASGEAKTFKSIPAPTREDVKTHITGADNGKTIDVAVGTAIAVEFVGIPTAGYLWSVAETPAFLKASGEAGGPTSEAQLQQGYSGGRHWEVFFFDVTAAGEGPLRFEQRRPWETEGPPDDTFSVTIRAN
jgi:predicted secreted protein